MYRSINMKEAIDYIKEKTGLDTDNRIREKLIEIFEMLNIDRSLLKSKTIEYDEKVTDGNEYLFPEESKEFLVFLISSFTDADVKEMRRGNFHNASIDKMKEIIEGFENMFRKMELTDSEMKQQLIKMYTRTKLPFWEETKKIQSVLNSMMEDLEVEMISEDIQVERPVDGEGIREALQKYRKRKFHYFEPLDNIDVNDQLVFLNMIHEDYEKLQQRHREIYRILSDMRSEEISDMAFSEASKMSSREEEEAFLDINYSIAVQNELDKNPSYQKLIYEREEILKTNDFVKKLQPKFKKVCDELDKIYKDTQIKMFGEVVLNDNLENIDFKNRKASHQALKEAIKDFEEQELQYREYSEEMAKITPDEWEASRVAINTILAEKGMPLIDNEEGKF